MHQSAPAESPCDPQSSLVARLTANEHAPAAQASHDAPCVFAASATVAPPPTITRTAPGRTCTYGTTTGASTGRSAGRPLEVRTGVNYEDPRWSAGVLWRLVAAQDRCAVNQGNIVGQDLGPTGGFGVLSLNGAWRPSTWILVSAGVDILFDKLYTQHLNRRGGAMVSGFEQTTRVAEPGRTRWLKRAGRFDRRWRNGAPRHNVATVRRPCGAWEERMTEGGCLCGALRYEIDGPFVDMLHCHCSMCRKHHGTPFATWAAAPSSGFRWLTDTATLTRYGSSPNAHRDFCSVCGSVAPTFIDAMGLVIVPAGNLDGDPGIRPSKHMFVGSKAQWYTITDDLPQHAEYPPEFGTPATPRPVIELKPGVAQGSCLCGEVAYEISTPPLRMYQCHCSRCRKGRSAAHCANVFYNAEGFRWTRGAELVQDFQLPSAQYFGTAFCRRCGSEVPRVSFERNMAVVPAGSLDSDPGIAPAGHIFVDSKAPWFEITDDIPQYAMLPPRS